MNRAWDQHNWCRRQKLEQETVCVIRGDTVLYPTALAGRESPLRTLENLALPHNSVVNRSLAEFKILYLPYAVLVFLVIL